MHGLYAAPDARSCMGSEPDMVGMPYDERDDSGRFESTYSAEDVTTVLSEIAPATTSGVAEELGCAYRTAYEYLTQLEEEGRVTRRRIGQTSEWELEEEDADDE